MTRENCSPCDPTWYIPPHSTPLPPPPHSPYCIIEPIEEKQSLPSSWWHLQCKYCNNGYSAPSRERPAIQMSVQRDHAANETTWAVERSNNVNTRMSLYLSWKPSPSSQPLLKDSSSSHWLQHFLVIFGFNLHHGVKRGRLKCLFVTTWKRIDLQKAENCDFIPMGFNCHHLKMITKCFTLNTSTSPLTAVFTSFSSFSSCSICTWVKRLHSMKFTINPLPHVVLIIASTVAFYLFNGTNRLTPTTQKYSLTHWSTFPLNLAK